MSVRINLKPQSTSSTSSSANSLNCQDSNNVDGKEPRDMKSLLKFWESQSLTPSASYHSKSLLLNSFTSPAGSRRASMSCNNPAAVNTAEALMKTSVSADPMISVDSIAAANNGVADSSCTIPGLTSASVDSVSSGAPAIILEQPEEDHKEPILGNKLLQKPNPKEINHIKKSSNNKDEQLGIKDVWKALNSAFGSYESVDGSSEVEIVQSVEPRKDSL